jgi:hypothetical protein
MQCELLLRGLHHEMLAQGIGSDALAWPEQEKIVISALKQLSIDSRKQTLEAYGHQVPRVGLTNCKGENRIRACAPSFFLVFVAPRVAILCGRRISFSECNESIVNCVERQLILVIPVPVVIELLLNVSSGL